ncbi:hypothetical protein FGB62_79g039 [Gracilaria domingensis]|nr:hypothetical protein FGB62_79g039 [Gracilaria domingensis]
MILIPLSSGVIAAFIFLIFELVVFPLLTYTTSKLASLFLHRHAKNGDAVRVEALKFPLWTEGLFRYQRSHTFLLVIRVLLVAIPVYLETTLISDDIPEFSSQIVSSAFIPEAVDDWAQYVNRTGERLSSLRELGTRVYVDCTRMDEDGWVWAKVANVTYLNEIQQMVQCLSGTQKPVFRPSDEITNMDSIHLVDQLWLNISWTEGRLQDFPRYLLSPDSVELAIPDDRAYQINEVSVLNSTDMQCFFADTAKVLDPSNQGFAPLEWIGWSGWCQKVEGKVARFYTLELHPDEVQLSENSLENVKSKQLCDEECSLVKMDRTVVGNVTFRGSFEYKDKILLNAKQLANVKPDLFGSTRAQNTARVVLYSKASNVTVQLPTGGVLHRTRIKVGVLVIVVVETFIVSMLALLLHLLWISKWRHIQEVNTLNGLSQCWAKYTEWSEFREKGDSKWIQLGLRRMSYEEENRITFEPRNADGMN